MKSYYIRGKEPKTAGLLALFLSTLSINISCRQSCWFRGNKLPMHKSSPAKVRSTDHNKESDDRSMKSRRSLTVLGTASAQLFWWLCVVNVSNSWSQCLQVIQRVYLTLRMVFMCTSHYRSPQVKRVCTSEACLQVGSRWRFCLLVTGLWTQTVEQNNSLFYTITGWYCWATGQNSDLSNCS